MSNCWYDEQPLDDGPPSPPFAGVRPLRTFFTLLPFECSPFIRPTIIFSESHNQSSPPTIVAHVNKLYQAKWKRDLCFRNPNSLNPEVYILDVTGAKRSLWSDKYAIRSSLARRSGNPGNSCIHLTDKQSKEILSGAGPARTGGMGCDDSYAYSCARALLCQESVNFLNSEHVARIELDSDNFARLWAEYVAWLTTPGVDVLPLPISCQRALARSLGSNS